MRYYSGQRNVGQLFAAAALGVASGVYIFNEPLKAYWASRDTTAPAAGEGEAQSERKAQK